MPYSSFLDAALNALAFLLICSFAAVPVGVQGAAIARARLEKVSLELVNGDAHGMPTIERRDRVGSLSVRLEAPDLLVLSYRRVPRIIAQLTSTALLAFVGSTLMTGLPLATSKGVSAALWSVHLALCGGAILYCNWQTTAVLSAHPAGVEVVTHRGPFARLGPLRVQRMIAAPVRVETWTGALVISTSNASIRVDGFGEGEFARLGLRRVKRWIAARVLTEEPS